MAEYRKYAQELETRYSRVNNNRKPSMGDINEDQIMNSFERFRNRNSKQMEAQSSLNTNFIFKGYPSIQLTHVSGGVTTLLENKNKYLKELNNNTLQSTKRICEISIQAAVVNQQEKDKAYIYTQLTDDLSMGSV